jgi:dephospho-CoA kinase
MMLIVGLTGAIASGKSTAAATFAEMGAAVFDADRTVHALYAGRAAAPIERMFPGTVKNGTVDRDALAARVVGDPAALAKLEAIVHPLVNEEETAFRARAAGAGRRVAILDIPLLLETGGAARVDAVVVVTAPPDVLKARALRRPGMDAARYAALLARQMNDAEKRARAHCIVDTSGDFAATREQIAGVMRAIAAMAAGR